MMESSTPPPLPSSGQRVAYLRVSSTDQNLGRQREIVGEVSRVFTDEVSARSRADRPGLAECVNYVREGDTLVVASIDRLARSLVDLNALVDEITAKGVRVEFVHESLEFGGPVADPRSRLMFGILGSFAEFERAIIRERQAEGIALAKKAGKYRGRTRVLTSDQIAEVRERVAAGESKVSVASEFGVSRATIYRALQH